MCVLIFHPQITRMTQILYFFSANDRIWAKPLKKSVLSALSADEKSNNT